MLYWQSHSAGKVFHVNIHNLLSYPLFISLNYHIMCIMIAVIEVIDSSFQETIFISQVKYQV